MKTTSACILGIFLATMGSSLLAASDQHSHSSVEATVRAFVNAYNAHDVDAMLAQTTDDIEWLSIAGKKVAVETRNKEQLRKAMTGYFNSTPSARSSIVDIMVSGNFVTSTERAYLGGQKSDRFQQALSVYELKNNRIKRVWYFPAQKVN